VPLTTVPIATVPLTAVLDAAPAHHVLTLSASADHPAEEVVGVAPAHPAFFCCRHGAFDRSRIGLRAGSILAGGTLKYWLPSLTTFHPWL
jgi:hypothetical protein